MSEWFGDLPERWESKRIGALLQQRKETNAPVKTDFILSLSAAHGVVPYSERVEKGGNKPKNDLTKYSIAHENDLLVNCMNVLAGSCGVSKWHGAISPVYYALYPRNADEINIWYYNYIFRLVTFYRSLIGISKGILVHESSTGSLNTIRLRVSMQNMNYVMMPLPPRNEQDQIVRFLDWRVLGINRLINAKKKLIALLQEQKRAAINEAVTRGGDGWQDVSLGNLGSFRKGFGGSRADDAESGGVACIRYGDIYRSGVLFLHEPITRITAESSVSYARVYKSEMLFALSGETKEEIGQALVNSIDEDTWCSGDAAIFTANDNVLYSFLAYALRCPYVAKQRASMAKGDIIVHISTSALRRLKILVPPIGEQEAIVSQLDTICVGIDSKIKIENEQMKLLQEYRTRLISDVVTGKMDVRDVVIPDYETVEETAVVEDDDADDSFEEAGDE
ncbi:restriction endonuclease subunit S [Paenibacillus aurantius]|uniref:Restriction endonuclease subunit S n=1 Tax=Paenibacillus aurantius TaxID=2918900 RepID=A0AA96LEF1_9BACL|nr:restriction endonuclease subunit S [Paenibacillus aurantius]WNQ12201.1 restriction endonuclease subunit S [Paenibacillus aurantius]